MTTSRARGGSAASRLRRDERGLVTGCLVRMALLVALLALAAHEGGRIAIAQIHAQSVARVSAEAGAETLHATSSEQRAADAVRAAAAKADPEARVRSIRFDAEGGVTVTVSEVAHTLLLDRISATRPWTVQHATDREATLA